MRKITIYFVLLFCVACGDTNNFLLDVTFPEGKDYNGKWAYLIGMYDRESTWLDSVIIENNVAKLRANLLYDEYLCELLIEDEPRTFNQFIFTPGENASFAFDPEIETQFPAVNGSGSSMQIAGYYSDRAKMMDSATIETLFKDAFSFIVAFHAALNASYAISPQRSEEMKTEILERWPNSINRSMITSVSPITGDSVSGYTDSYKRVQNRRAIIIGETPRFVEVEQIASTRDTPYNVGDVVEDFVIPLVYGDELSLLNSDKEFTLIDFWASWCTPCREEIPNILYAHSEFADRLNIVMVSIDSNINNCKQAIDKDGSDQLNHAILREDNPNYQNIMKLFGVETIPCNVLLDSDGRIVTRNLRGESLIEYLKGCI